MERINILIIAMIVIIAVCAGILIYMNVGGEIQYTTLQVNDACAIQVPVTNNNKTTVTDIGYGMSSMSYVDYQHDLTIIASKAPDISGVDYSQAMDMLKGQTSNIDMEQMDKEVINGTTYYHDKTTGIYEVYIIDEKSNTLILVACKDLEILKHIVASVDGKSVSNDNNVTKDSPASSNAEIDEELGFYDYDGDGISDWGQHQGSTKDQIIKYNKEILDSNVQESSYSSGSSSGESYDSGDDMYWSSTEG